VITWKDAFKIGVAVGIFFAMAMGLFGFYIGKKIETVVGGRGERVQVTTTCVTNSHYLIKIQIPSSDLFSQLSDISFFLDGQKVNCQKIEEKDPNIFACKISERTDKGIHTLVITSGAFGSMRSVICP